MKPIAVADTRAAPHGAVNARRSPNVAPPTLHLHIRRVVVHGGIAVSGRRDAAMLADSLRQLLERPDDAALAARAPAGVTALVESLRGAVQHQLARIDGGAGRGRR